MDLPLKWLGFAGMTPIVFGYAISAFPPSGRTQKFWLLLTVFFVAHIGIGVFVLTRFDTVPLALYGLMVPAEYVLLAAYLGHFLDSK